MTARVAAPLPPATTIGPVGWLRKNLFSSPSNSVVTVVMAILLAWIVVNLGAWVVVQADWTVIVSRVPLYIVGLYPYEAYWRLTICLLLISVLLGMTWRAWPDTARRFAYGFGAIMLFVGVFPHEMAPVHRALLLLNLPAIGLGYMLTPRAGESGPGLLEAIAGGALSSMLDRAAVRLATAWCSVVRALLPPLYGVAFRLATAWCRAVAALSRMLDRVAIPLATALRRPARALAPALDRAAIFSTPRRMLTAVVVALVVTMILILGIDGVPGLDPVAPQDVGGLLINLLLAFFGIVCSLPIGIGLALGRRSSLPVVKVACVIFIEVIRGVPLITLLFMSRHILPLTLPEDLNVDRVYLAGITITLFSSAYMAENVRGGMAAVHPGQAEAASALGLRGWQTTLLINLPQGLRNIIPAIVGQFISLFKDTSLVYFIGMLDLVEMGRVSVQGNQEFIDNGREVYLFIALVFWVFCFSMSFISRRIEGNLGVGRR